MLNVWKRLIILLGLCVLAVTASAAQADAISPTVLLAVPAQQANYRTVYSSGVTGSFKTVFEHENTTQSFVGISPDGRYSVFVTNDGNANQTLVVQDLMTKQRFITDFKLLGNNPYFVIVLSQNPHLWTLASCEDNSVDWGVGEVVHFMNRQTHQLTLTIRINAYGFCDNLLSDISMSPDGNSVMAFYQCGNLAFTHFDTHLTYRYAPYEFLEGGCLSPEPDGGFLWSRDSQSIIGVRHSDGIDYYNPFFFYSPGYPKTLLNLRGIGELFDWQPNHNAFLFSAHTDQDDKPAEKLFLFNMTTRMATEIPVLGTYPRWSPNGQYIAGSRLSTDSAGNPRFDVVVYDIEHATMISLTTDQPGSTCNPQWSPDGMWIAYELVDAQQGKKTGCFNPHGVAAIRWLTHSDWTLLSPNSTQPITLIGWVQP